MDFETAVEAGERNEELKDQAKGWGLTDSIVLCIARSISEKVVTGDEHFHELNDVIFIKKNPLRHGVEA